MLFTERWTQEQTLPGTPGYYADYYEGCLVEEMTNEYTKKADTYQSNSYEFYDYDEAGNMIWRRWTNLHDDCLYLYQHLYNEDGQTDMELTFRVEGDWEQTLMDGSTIAFHRDEDGYLTDITRTDVSGGLMHCFLFDEEHHLAYQTDANGAVETYWQMTGEEYLAMLEEDLGEPDHSNTGQGIYHVEAGNCLWSIAESLWGDGAL